MSDQNQAPSSPSEASLTDFSSVMATQFVIPDAHLKIGEILVGDRVELLTKKTHYILDRLGDDDWRIHAFETPSDSYKIAVLGCQPTDSQELLPGYLCEGMRLAVRVIDKNARMTSGEIVLIVWKKGYH